MYEIKFNVLYVFQNEAEYLLKTSIYCTKRISVLPMAQWVDLAGILKDVWQENLIGGRLEKLMKCLAIMIQNTDNNTDRI